LQPRVLIAGAGVAGLTATLCFARRGIRPLVVEKARDLRADGFILTLSHHCFDILDELGLLNDLRAVQNNVLCSRYRDRSGRVVLELDYTRLFEAGRVLQLMRDDLQSVLYQHAQAHAEFRFDTSVAAIVEHADDCEVTFADGTRERFDIVIGADGVHSSVRDAAFAPAFVRRHPLGLHAAAFRTRNTLDLTHTYEAYLEPSRHTIVYSTRTGELAGIFIWRARDATLPNERAARLTYLANVYADADRRLRELIEGIAVDARLYMDGLVQIDMPTWRSGHVIMAGDGAHALTQLSGQGASCVDHPVAQAAAAYEARVRPQIARLQPAIRRNARWYVPRHTLDFALRNLAFRAVPNEWWIRYFKRKYANA
jgi:2-polyprenyl-6-methoxyphenol hydroxylase-like FAD-dependent oxidoreductase